MSTAQNICTPVQVETLENVWPAIVTVRRVARMVGEGGQKLRQPCTSVNLLLFLVILAQMSPNASGSPSMYGVIRNTGILRNGWSRYYDGLERLGYQTPSARRTAPAMCETDIHWKRLCVQCAKITKSPWAFPLCCNKDLSAPQFCTNLVQFGMP